MHRDQLSDAPRSGGPGFSRGLDRSDVASNKDCDITIEEVFAAYKNDIRGLHHRVGSLDSANQTARFYHSEGVHEAANLPEIPGQKQLTAGTPFPYDAHEIY
jgi:hypothetical protein